MALNLRSTGDYIVLPDNVVPGFPKSGWTPAEGQLVVQDGTGDNFFDLAADSEVPVGIVMTTNGATGALGIALLLPGTQLVLPFTTAPTLGNQIQAAAGGLKIVGTATFSRSQVKGVASGGIGTVIDLATFGVSGTGTETTATVRF
jgi:hypothetical protein